MIGKTISYREVIGKPRGNTGVASKAEDSKAHTL
jgi:hypothetical protein